jgi:hypothetical protein
MNPCSYAHPIFDKGSQTYNGEKTASSTNDAGKTGYLHAENRNCIMSFSVQVYTQSGLGP